MYVELYVYVSGCNRAPTSASARARSDAQAVKLLANATTCFGGLTGQSNIDGPALGAAAVVGTAGSGKSTAVDGVLKNLFQMKTKPGDFDEGRQPSSRVVVLNERIMAVTGDGLLTADAKRNITELLEDAKYAAGLDMSPEDGARLRASQVSTALKAVSPEVRFGSLDRLAWTCVRLADAVRPRRCPRSPSRSPFACLLFLWCTSSICARKRLCRF